MQMRLQSGEFAYLLHTVGTNKVVGVDNAQLFPAEKHESETLLQHGFSALKEHGWLVPDEQGYIIHTELVLLTAVVANPEFVFVLTLATPNGGKQFATYYLAQGFIVEQIFTSEREYLLSKLEQFDMLVEQIGQALSITTEAHPWVDAVSVESGAFEQAMRQTTNGNLNELKTLLSSSNDEISKISSLAGVLKTLQPMGRVECVKLSGNQLQIWYDMFVYLDVDKHTWIMTSDPQTDFLTFHPLDFAAFAAFLSKITPETENRSEH